MYGLRYETGLNFGWITPYLALEDKLFQAPSYTETAASGAASYALSYASHTSNNAELELGARQDGSLPLDANWSLGLSDRLAWRHDTLGQFEANPAFAALPGSGFTTDGLKPGEDAALISLGAALRNRYGLDLDLHFDSSVSSRSQSYTGIAGLNYNW
jgi:outer membrane autotransporter protein